MTSDDARNRTDMVSHAPALVAGEIADRRVGKTAVAGDGGQAGDECDERPIDGRPATRFESYQHGIVNVGTVAFSISVLVDEFDRFAVGVRLPVVGDAVAVAIDGFRQVGLDDIQSSVAIKVLSWIQHTISVPVFPTFDGHSPDLQKADNNFTPIGRFREKQPHDQ